MQKPQPRIASESLLIYRSTPTIISSSIQTVSEKQMLFALLSFLLPPLFVFGVYHLLTWFNVLHINGRVLWKRVAMTSAICHVVLASGFFLFCYFDAGDRNFGAYLFNESNFWK